MPKLIDWPTCGTTWRAEKTAVFNDGCAEPFWPRRMPRQTKVFGLRNATLDHADWLGARLVN